MGYRITDDIEKLKAVLPTSLIDAIEERGQEENLIEIIMDLGRIPTARYTDGEIVLENREVEREVIDYVVTRVGDFDADNRAGIERTLHRISAIRNRRGEVVGLTCRIGRAVYGTIDIIQDLVESGKSILILGPPGVGKTTMLREAARVLADKRRVVIVDTSNEIGGDGDVPHPAVGRARRMQVPQPSLQHEIMIEAVENHNPEVIVIDEIGRELEAQAARTIAERGVQLIGTAHGNTLDNILLNPTLSDLVGGVEAVTLSDDEARRRGTQKTVLERRAPPTFDVLIELQSRSRLLIHEDVAAAVDAHLRGRPLAAELRYREENGQIQIESYTPAFEERTPTRGGKRERPDRERHERHPSSVNGSHRQQQTETTVDGTTGGGKKERRPVKAYAYGVARNRLVQSARRLNVPLILVDEPEDAEVMITLKSYYRQRPRMIVDAERNGVSIYVLRANTVTQLEDFLADLFELEDENSDNPFSEALQEVEEAIQQIRAGKAYMDLKPQPAHLRRQQHDVVRQANLVSHSYGSEPYRYVRIIHPQSR